MKILKILTIALTLMLISCDKEKDEVLLPCEIDQSGPVVIINNLGEDFEIYFDGAYVGTLSNNESKGIGHKNAGGHQIKAKEVDYLIIQDEFTFSITVEECVENQYFLQ